MPKRDLRRDEFRSASDVPCGLPTQEVPMANECYEKEQA